MSEAPLAGLDVAVLAGGLGTRIRPVLGTVPKVLAPIGDRPFLDILLDWLENAGARRIVLCLGHLADKVESWLDTCPPRIAQVVVAVEPIPLGTAGALARHRPLLTSDPVLVINGDTLVDADLEQFVTLHRTHAPQASMLCAQVDDARSYGSVTTDPDGMVKAFTEKADTIPGPGLVNAGLYLLSSALLDHIARTTPTSLERDVLPGLSRLLAVPQPVTFTDIGTPERLAALRLSGAS